jgi:kinesin family protein C1
VFSLGYGRLCVSGQSTRRDMQLMVAHESSDPDALPDIGFSDERTDQETGQSQLVVKSRSESATGREREQINNFTFDKVSL